MKWAPGECVCGDMVRIKTGSVYHYGVFISEGEVIQFGYPPLPEYAGLNSPPTVNSVDIDTFCGGRIVERAVPDRAEKKMKLPPEKTAQIARSRVGEGGYNIIHNNCEHFANECVFGVRRSEQEEAVRRKWQKRTVCDVYVSYMPDGYEPHISCAAGKDRAENAPDGETRLIRYYVWEMLEYALKRSAGADPRELVFGQTPDGDLTVKNGSVFFSLADTGRYAAVAVSDRPVGIGAETAEALASVQDKEALKASLLHRSEKVSDDRELLILQTKKESIVRQTGVNTGLSRIKASKYGTKTFYVPEYPECMISVCGETDGMRCHVFKNGGAEISAVKQV